ncbi:hypothetical protein L6452_38574 [Arctium lappa]|uniref:Uncharacterized protein n=1 Tax=Arctium lappa TaxID=4217 RepID=A0ACB8XQT7_ARCLA|nr:hypothetical protein L6452_38574 [Arctium lappa]
MMNKFKELLPSVIKKLRDFPRIRLSKELRWTYASDVPQHRGTTGDCGVWICKFLSTLTDGDDVLCTGDAREEARHYRCQMAEVFYACARRVGGEYVSACLGFYEEGLKV